MNTRTTAPSLFGHAEVPRAVAPPELARHQGGTLVDLLYDGFYMVFLLRAGREPHDGEGFREQLRLFLKDFETRARRLGVDADDTRHASFAFCALVDEVILQSGFECRARWELKPLQLELFGDHLAGERFFDQLEQLRQGGAARVQVLEVFHLCLLLGFQGRYLLEGHEKLDWLTARLGDEIAHLRGRRAGFAPHGEPPDRIAHQLRHELPLWTIGAVVALMGLLAFIGLRVLLQQGTGQDLATFDKVIAHTPRQAHVTISWP